MSRGRLVIKYFSRFAVLLVTLGVLYLGNLFLMRPWSIDHFLAKELILDAIDSPESLTYLGVVDDFNWLTNHQSSLSIYTPEDLVIDVADLERSLDTLSAFNDDFLTLDQQITKQIAMFDYGNYLEELSRFPYHEYPLNQMSGVHIDLVEFMTDIHPVRTQAEAEAYLERLEMLEAVFLGTLDSLREQEELGIFPPEFVFAHLENQISDFLEKPVVDNPLYSVFSDKLSELELPAEDRQDYLGRAEEIIDGSVRAGYQKLLDYVLTNQSRANKSDGVWSLPEGEAYYALMLKAQTTTDYSADEIHQMGLDEVERITARMSQVLSDLGYDPTIGVGNVMNALNDSDEFLYADTPDRKKIVIRDYEQIVRNSWEQVSDYFVSMPIAQVEVRAVPEYSEQSQAGGYYSSPALDGSRPGIFYANLYDVKQTPTYSMAALAFHEALPGHHLQIALNLENTDLSLYRRFGYGTSAFSEGWALYAESLAIELGMGRNQFDELGVLQSELFRAVRLVVDTGLHRKRWTREQAIEYMKGVTGMSDTEVVVEIERYIVWPGQACSYKVGGLKILELRERAKRALGADFSLRDFHSVVLGHGEPPLFVVEELVDRYIEEHQAF